MQAFAGRVERQRALRIGNMDIQTDVGIGDTDIGAFAVLLAEIVHDGVFHFIGHELRMTELLGIDYRVDRKSRFQIEKIVPFHAAHGVVDIVGISCLKSFDGFQNSDGGAQAEVGAVHHCLVARKRHHAPSDFDVVGTELGQFLRQNLFKALEGFGN